MKDLELWVICLMLLTALICVFSLPVSWETDVLSSLGGFALVFLGWAWVQSIRLNRAKAGRK